jgi:hypothetical protein
MTGFRSLLLAALLWLSPELGAAEEFPMDGLWDAERADSAGVSSDNGWNAAARIEGRTVSVAGNSHRLPDGAVCVIGEGRTQIWHEDIRYFGSFGGSWADVGLIVEGIDYVVELRSLDCDTAGPIGLIIQEAKGKVLMDVGGNVFVPLVGQPEG